MRIAAVASILIASTLQAGSTIVASRAALSTPSPIATKVGLEVLRNGGTAIDAAVAASFALADIGGGGFLLYYDAANKGVWTLDFRETAPGGATRDMKLAPGARSAAVPGTVAGLAAAHERFGSRPWKELVAPAARLARENAEYAATLERIAATGATDFYRGETAKRMVDAVKAAGGVLGDRDLRGYEAVWRAPLQIRFRDYDIYAMPPPSGGGLVFAEALNILAGFDLKAAGYQTVPAAHLLAEAMRRAFIDRNRYVGDPTSTRIPLGDLLSPKRANEWRSSIDMRQATPSAKLADPSSAPSEGTDAKSVAVMDDNGNIAVLTMSAGGDFAVSGAGFTLNDAMTEFGTGTPNSIEPGKRMMSSMTPVIILKSSRPFLAVTSDGGAATPNTILQVFLNMVVHERTLAEAVAAPRVHHQAEPERVEFELGRTSDQFVAAINALGHGTHVRDSIGDVHAISVQNGRITAVADPRHGGSAGGF